MKTTAIIAEMVAIGLVALIWMALFAFPYLKPFLQSNQVDMNILKDLATPLTIMAVLLCYYVGWLVNGITYWLSIIIRYGNFKNEIMQRQMYKSYCEGYSYKDIRAIVYHSANQTFLTELDLDRTAMRIARTGILNFSMLFLAILKTPWLPNFLGVFALLLCFFSFIELWRRCDRYYNEIVSLFVHMKKQEGEKA